MSSRYVNKPTVDGITLPEDVHRELAKLAPRSKLPWFPVTSKGSIFTLSFWSYCAMKVSNKSYSLIQPILVKERFFVSEIFDSNYSGQTSMVGMISTIFLICYASGQFFAGALADRSNLRYFIGAAMAMAGALAVAFGAAGLMNIRQVWLYCIIWALNGFAQACGWPSNLSVMNNWFGKKARGLVFSAWSSNSNIGNIIGSVLCGLIFWILRDSPVLWQLTMVMCGLVAVIGALPIYLLMVPDPKDMPSATEDRSPPPVRELSAKVVPVDVTQTGDNSSDEGIDNDIEKEEKDSDDIVSTSNTLFRVRRHSVERGQGEAALDAPLEEVYVPPQMGFFESVFSALGKRGVFVYALIYACVKGVVYVYIYWMPLFLTSAKGMTNSQAAYVSTIFDIGAFIGGLFFGHVTDLIGSRTLVILGMVFSGTILATVLFTTQSSMAVVCVILFFCGMSAGAAQILISGSVALDLGDAGGEEAESSGDESKSKRQSATITGIIEGSGSAGAALLQYAVGALLVCEDGEEGDNVTCSWDRVLLVLTVANILSFSCLLYLKVSGRAKKVLSKLHEILMRDTKVLPTLSK